MEIFENQVPDFKSYVMGIVAAILFVAAIVYGIGELISSIVYKLELDEDSFDEDGIL